MPSGVFSSPFEIPAFILKTLSLMHYRLFDLRSLALNRVVADKTRKNSVLMDQVRVNLEHVLSEGDLFRIPQDSSSRVTRHSPPLLVWENSLPSHRDSHEGQHLRSSTPFWGSLLSRNVTKFFCFSGGSGGGSRKVWALAGSSVFAAREKRGSSFSGPELFREAVPSKIVR